MTDRNLMKFTEIKSEVVLHRRSNLRYQAGGSLAGKQVSRKALRNLTGIKLAISQQGTLVEKVTSILSYNRKNHTSRLREVSLPLYSALVIYTWSAGSSAGAYQWKGNMELLDQGLDCSSGFILE